MQSTDSPEPLTLFPPRRRDALARLSEFAPRAGRDYARQRNFDAGPGRRNNVSLLSPYLRHRVLTEREVISAVLERNSPAQAEKFIQEVMWRTYWKGWLQMRPGVWQSFIAERDADRAQVSSDDGLSVALDQAERGATGIECFDAWTRELVETGYLHNHARMWFASIWIFTLRLPWALGADFFLRHLLDADPASNTLGWRWVAGIQTPGKTYLARADNIEKYTDGRYRPTGLATEARPIREEQPPRPVPPADFEQLPRRGRLLVLLHDDDLSGLPACPERAEIAGVVIASGGHPRQTWPFGDKARDFVNAAARDTADRINGEQEFDVTIAESLGADAVSSAAAAIDADQVLTPDAPVGPLDDGLRWLIDELSESGLKLYRFRRDWDRAAWPLATRGFFAFKKHIPRLLEDAGL